MRNKLFITLLLIGLGAIISYLFSGSLWIYLLTLITGGMILYFSNHNNIHRKENLNIIRDEEKLYFYLSDDLLFSVDLPQNTNIADTLKSTLKKEMSTIHEITRKVCFINFKNDKLLQELNASLGIQQK